MKSVFSEHCSLSLFILSYLGKTGERQKGWKDLKIKKSQLVKPSEFSFYFTFFQMGCDHFHFLFSKTGKNQGCEENQRRKEEVRHDVEACIKYGQMGLSESAS